MRIESGVFRIRDMYAGRISYGCTYNLSSETDLYPQAQVT